MKKFDLHGWDYGHGAEQVASLTERIAKFHPDRGMGRIIMRHCFEHWGGKAFGLALCECLAAQIPNCSVPLWTAFTYEEQARRLREPEDLGFFGGVPIPPSKKPKWIWRSSDPSEDWLDPRAGVLKSHTCDRKELWNKLREIHTSGQPLVLQQCVEGIGIVVDIGYSDLLRQPIVRLAFGRRVRNDNGHIVYTSPTRDTEVTVFVWESKTRKITRWSDDDPKSEGTGFHKRTTLNGMPERLASELYKAVQSLGLNFGMQFEFYVHPDYAQDLYLVQVRPSSMLLRGITGKRIPELMKTHHGYGDPSPAVNKTFEVEGDVRVIDWSTYYREDPIRERIRYLVNEIARGQIPLLEETDQLLRGKIALVLGYSDKYLLQEEAAALAALGAVGIISTHGYSLNTAHGDVIGYGSSAIAERQATLRSLVDKACGVMRIGHQTQDELMRRVDLGETIKIRMVSDGLVGYIFGQQTLFDS